MNDLDQKRLIKKLKFCSLNSRGGLRPNSEKITFLKKNINLADTAFICLQDLGSTNQINTWFFPVLSLALASESDANRSAKICTFFNSNFITHCNSRSLIEGRLIESEFQLTNASERFLVFNIYVAASNPSSFISSCLPLIQNSIDAHPYHDYFFIGDFNVNFFKPSPTLHTILKFCDANNFVELDPTAIPTWRGDGLRDSESKLDICFSNITGWEQSIIMTPMSDHAIIFFAPPPSPFSQRKFG